MGKFRPFIDQSLVREHHSLLIISISRNVVGTSGSMVWREGGGILIWIFSVVMEGAEIVIFGTFWNFLNGIVMIDQRNDAIHRKEYSGMKTLFLL